MRVEWNGEKFKAKIPKAETLASHYVGFVVVGAIQSIVRVKTGALKISYHYQVVGTHVVRIGSPLKYAATIEYGSSAHIIRSKGPWSLSDGKQYFGRVVHHPGTAAQPHVRPVLADKTMIRGLYREKFKEALGI